MELGNPQAINEILRYKYRIWISVARQGVGDGLSRMKALLIFGGDVCIVLDSLTSTPDKINSVNCIDFMLAI